MHAAFLTRLQADPADDATRLVYADWLDDQGDSVSLARAEFLRLAVAVAADPRQEGGDGRRDRLQQRAAELDGEWLLAVTRLPIGNFHELPSAGWRIVRNKPIRKIYGVAIPAFIHNFDYHLTGIGAYADGAIDCWGFVDLPLFRQNVAAGWVSPQPPPGAWVSIHNLGRATVQAADWALSPEDMVRRVEEAVRELNPEGAGLLDVEESEFVYVKPYRVASADREALGGEVPVFLAEGDWYRLTRWSVYADRTAQVGYGPVVAPFESVAALFESGRLTTSVPDGAWVEIDGLGRFRIGEGHWGVKAGERIREALDLIDVANGLPGAQVRYMMRYHDFEADPSDVRRESLRQAYEAVPLHHGGLFKRWMRHVRQILGLEDD